MRRPGRKLVLLALLALCLAVFGAGMGAAWLGRHSMICKDGRPPVKQRAAAMEPTEYLCHNGQVVTENFG